MNGEFLDKYGKTWERMSDDEKQMAFMSEIFDLREAIKPVKGFCETVARHVTYFRAIAIITGLVLTGVIGWLVARVLA